MQKELVVQKFGGTSVGSIERIRNVAQIIKSTAQSQNNIVVVSAMAGSTNKLVEMSQEMSHKPQPEAYDMLLASGEQVSCALLSMALTDIGVKALPLMAFQAGIETDHSSTQAKIARINPKIISSYLNDGYTPIIAGFQGISHNGKQSIVTTLGRGGSDTSAVAVAVALKATRCDIFTDVDGVYTADPRIVPEAKRIDKISFSEMMELASLGAKVLHMRSVELAAKYQMPLRVLSTFQPNEKGTTLMNPEDLLESPVVSSVTSSANETLMSVRVSDEVAQYPAKFFRPLADKKINVDVIVKTPQNSNNRSTISFTVPSQDTAMAIEALKPHEVDVHQEPISKVSIVGLGMTTHHGVAATMFETLEKANIPIFLVSTSEIKISVLIASSLKDDAVRAIHRAFQLDK